MVPEKEAAGNLESVRTKGLGDFWHCDHLKHIPAVRISAGFWSEDTALQKRNWAISYLGMDRVRALRRGRVLDKGVTDCFEMENTLGQVSSLKL